MLKKQLLILALLFCIGTISPIFPGDAVLNVSNNDFETMGSNGIPAHWTVEKDKGTPGIKITADRKEFHSGKQGLLISHPDWGTSTVASEPLALQTGHLYRLSGWIKTQSAHTDPIHHYPTPVAACFTMESFPFTNHSPSLGATSDWQEISVLFIATQAHDRIRLHLGFNGEAKGNAWFDDIKLEKVDDISAYIPPETVQWFGPGFRYDDKGWIFVHIEGSPYQRGYQYGYLLANEIAAYMSKIGYQFNNNDTDNGWDQVRTLTDALMLRKYEEEGDYFAWHPFHINVATHKFRELIRGLKIVNTFREEGFEMMTVG